MMGGERIEGGAFEILPFSSGGETLLVTERKPDEAGVLERGLDLGEGRIEELGETHRRDSEGVLQGEHRFDRGRAEGAAERAEMIEIDFARLAHAAAARIQHDTATEG